MSDVRSALQLNSTKSELHTLAGYELSTLLPIAIDSMLCLQRHSHEHEAVPCRQAGLHPERLTWRYTLQLAAMCLESDLETEADTSEVVQTCLQQCALELNCKPGRHSPLLPLLPHTTRNSHTIHHTCPSSTALLPWHHSPQPHAASSSHEAEALATADSSVANSLAEAEDMFKLKHDWYQVRSCMPASACLPISLPASFSP